MLDHTDRGDSAVEVGTGNEAEGVGHGEDMREIDAGDDAYEDEDSEDEDDDDGDRDDDGAWWPFNRGGPMRGVQSRVVQGIASLRGAVTPRFGPSTDPHNHVQHAPQHDAPSSGMGMPDVTRQLRDLVVVKMVPVADVNEATVAAEEARELRRLEHRHVVRSYDDFLHFETRSTLVSRLLGAKLGRRLNSMGKQL